MLASGVAKTPTASQLEYGELAINYNTDDPAIFLKDSNNNVIRISGVGNIADDGQVELPATTTPPLIRSLEIFGITQMMVVCISITRMQIVLSG